MGARRVGRYWGLVLFGFLATGCTSTKDRCESLCHWLDRCGGDDVDVSCTKSEVDSCVDGYEKLSDDCQDAFDDFADCLDNNDKCEDVGSECGDEAGAVSKECRISTT